MNNHQVSCLSGLCINVILVDDCVTCQPVRSIALWGSLKKKPLVTVTNAHSGLMDDSSRVESTNSESVSDDDDDVEPDDVQSDGLPSSLVTASFSDSVDFQATQKENWVTSVAALHNTDLVVSGKRKSF